MIDLVLTVFIWGLSFALAKKALVAFSPFELVTLRLTFGALTAWGLFVFFEKKSKIQKPLLWRQGAILGLFEFAGTYIFYTWSLAYLPSGVVGTLTLFTPVIAFVMGYFAKVYQFSWKAVLAITLSVVGAGLCLPLTAIFKNLSLNSNVTLGVCLLMISNALFAAGNIMISRLEKRQAWDQRLTAFGMGVGALAALIVTILRGNVFSLGVPNVHAFFLPLYLGIIATGLGFYLWNRGVQKVSAVPATVVGNFKGPMSLLWGFVLLREQVSIQLFLGMILLFIATVILPRKKLV